MDDAELVESGGFRIDRKRALKKLQRYQLPDPERGVFFWVRAAVATGAKRLEVRHGAGFLEIRFDGHPFSKSEFGDPYGGLFYGDNLRRKQLALGLLWLVRLEPSSLIVDSGGHRLSVDSIEKDSISESDMTGRWTVVRAKWGGLFRAFKSAPWKRSPVEYGLRCAMSGLEIKVSGREIVEDPFEGREVVHAFSWKGARVKMSYWNSPAGAKSVVDLSVLGVRVDSVKYKPHYAPCWVLANWDQMAVDASEFKAVKNEWLDSLLERIAREEKKVLEKALDVYEKNPEQEGALGDSVREACWILLKRPATDRRSPLLRRLWDCRCWFDEKGKGHSLWELGTKLPKEKIPKMIVPWGGHSRRFNKLLERAVSVR